MFRSFRHTLLAVLLGGIFVSAVAAAVVQPDAAPAIAMVTGGATATGLLCARLGRRFLQHTIGRLRRAADDVGRGLPVEPLEVRPGHDLYKLNAAINLLMTRVTEARTAEQRLHAELRRRERLAFLGELAATVAHEVNNPLDGVQNCARILRRSREDPQRAAQMLDLIDDGLKRIELIVRRLLTLAREHVIRPGEARLGEIVRQALQATAPKLDAAGVRVHVETAADDDHACVDGPLLEQVFVNLFMNAADSMPDGGDLRITIRTESAPRAELCVDVADTGAGIPAELLPHIFEPFFTTKAGGRGTGLGLAIAGRIVDAHHGVLSVAPGEPYGAVFTVRLPVQSNVDFAHLPDTAPAAPPSTPPTAAQTPPPAPHT